MSTTSRNRLFRLGSIILLPTLLLLAFFYALTPATVSTASDEGKGKGTTAVLAPPIANDDTYTTTEDIPLFVAAPGFLVNDSHPDLEVFTPTLIAPPNHGSLQFNVDGSFIYTPTLNFNGIDSFVYQLYDGLPLAALAYLPFDDGNNPTADVTGNGHDGTLVNGPTFTTTVPITLGTGSALRFDGTDDTVNLAGTVNLANQSFTVAFWAKRNSIGTFDVAAGQGTGTNSNALHIGFRNSNVFTCAFWNNDLNTAATYTDLDWHHWACVFDALSQQRQIYRDGVLVASDTASANYVGSGTFTVGSRQGSDPFDGFLDDVRIYNQPLAPAEIANAMLGNAPGTGEADTAVVTLNVTAVNDAPVTADDFYTTTQNTPFSPPPIEQSLTTLFASNNGQDGNMFNVTATTNDLTIKAFDLNINATGSREVIVYYKAGTYAGSEQTPANWTLLDTFMVDAQGQNNPTFLDISSTGGITIPAGEVYGLYLSVTDTALNFRYTNGSNTYSDDYLSISTGTGNPYPFGIPIGSRTWNGRIYYEIYKGVLTNDYDPDKVPLTAALENGPSFGVLSFSSTGEFVYTPTIVFAGIDTFTYIASDGMLTNTATVSIYVEATPCMVETTGDNITDYATADASAVQQALQNANPGDWLKIAGTCAGVQNINGFSQTVYLTQSVTLAGGYTATNWLADPDPSAHPTLLDAQGEGHVVNVTAGLTPTLLNLTLTGGNDTAVRVSTATTMTISHTQFISNSGVEGSAIRNDGHLTIHNSTFRDNQASVDGTIYNLNHLTITGSAFHDNTAERGGAVYNEATGTFVLFNSTIADNQAAEGGAIHSRGVMTVTHSTLAGNSANFGAGIHAWGGSSVFALFNNIIANNSNGSQCFNDGATLQNSLNNIITNGSCGATLTDDPLLAPLGDNGGPTWTMLPQAFSPALDFIPAGNIGCGTLYTADQRNLPRPIDGACDIGAVEIQTNFAPTVAADTYTTTEDIPLVISAPGVLANDSDGDFDPFTAVLATPVANGSLSFNSNGSFIYTPTLNFNGTDWFTYQADDGEDLSTVVTVTLTVLAENDAPLAAVDAYTTTEDIPLIVSNINGVLSNDSDIDNDVLTAILATNVTTGTLELGSDGSFTYTPPANWFGTATFTYQADDGEVLSTPVTVTLTVLSENDAPVADAGANQTAVEGELLTFEGSYSDPGRLWGGGVSIAWAFGDGATAVETLTPTHIFANNGLYTVTLTITDSEGAADSDTLLVTVSNANPTLDPLNDITVTVGTAISFTTGYADAGLLDTHTATVNWGEGDSEAVTVANFLVSGFHTYASAGIYTVTVTLMDDDGGEATQSFVVTVTDVPSTGFAIFLPLVQR